MLFMNFKRFIFSSLMGVAALAYADPSINQTDEITPVIVNGSLPFQVQVDQAGFSLPNGIHSFATGFHNGMFLFITGRTNGMHGFNDDTHNFPPAAQNTVIYVVDPINQIVYTRSMNDASSGLNQTQIDSLSVTSPQSYQRKDTLYITGGYGVDTATGEFSTKPYLTAIDVPGLMHWVIDPKPYETAQQYIRQISNSAFQVTGGVMTQIGDHPTLLIFGQNFSGFYFDGGNGIYTKRVRRFHIRDDGHHLTAEIISGSPLELDQSYRRRDLNIIPIVRQKGNKLNFDLVAYSGVFTVAGGIWTVPVTINAKGQRTCLIQGLLVRSNKP